MMDASIVDGLAQAYHAAEKSRQRTKAPSILHEGFSVDDAYAVQRRWIELKLAEGQLIKGYKIGLTSRAMQRQSNITEPDYGTLMSDMFYENGADIPIDRFLQPLVECEIGFVLGRPLKGPGCTIFDVLAATDYVVPAIEIVDARTHRSDPDTGRAKCVLDNIADNAANAAVVIGGRPMRPMDVDLRWIAALLFRNNVIEDSGVSAAVLNHPANGVAWLVNKLAAFDLELQPGHFVMGGSFTGTTEARAGDVFYVDYGPMGSISARFV